MGNRWCGIALALAAVIGSGCGSREIEPDKAEAFIRGAVRPAPRAVHCPDGVKVEKGKTLRCDVTTTDGGRATITLHMTDDDGKVAVRPGDLKFR